MAKRFYNFGLKDTDRKAMSRECLSQMGPPVFNGGFSTFLAFLLLAWSASYVFTTFFKVICISFLKKNDSAFFDLLVVVKAFR